MRFVQTTPNLLTLLFATFAVAHPYPRDDLQDAGFGYLMPRQCAAYCGADNQYCCADGETCQTSAGVAGCATAGAGGSYNFITTTWTRTYTSTISSFIPGPTTAASGGSNGEDCVPPEGSGQIPCGPICCATWQYCAYNGQCKASETAGSWTQWTTVGVVTTQYSAPYRVTSGSTIFETSSPTGTAASATASSTTSEGPAPVATTSNSLSGGAIAGIVVGTVAGVFLLLLLCFCCIVRGLWSTIAGIFGLGPRRRNQERVEIIEERYSRHGSRHGSAYGAAGRPSHRTWFGGGGGGGRPASAADRKEKKSGSGLGWLAAGAGTLALLLGLRRDERRKAAAQKPPRSDWSSSYYTDSYTASNPSSRSSDRRTRDTRRSRNSRTSRTTRASRPSRI